MNTDLRKLNLYLKIDGYAEDPIVFVKHYKLSKQFKKEFEMGIDKWDYSICDNDVFETLFKYLNTEDEIFFCVYDDSLHKNIIYKLIKLK